MGYVLVENFGLGVDRTRPRAVGPNGSIWAGINGNLSRGGDFETAKEFVATYSLPAGTVGLAKTAAGLRVFGHDTTPAGMPSGVTYVQLAHPTTPTLAISKIKSWDLFNGALYVIVQYANGDVRHFYNGSIVSDWDVGGVNPSGYGTVARTHQRKMYSPVDSILWFSELDTANNFDTGASGSGFLNMSTHQSGSDAVTALGVFQSQLAVFARRVVQIWTMTADDATNAPGQTLNETGTRAPRSVVGFGDLDCFYLSDSGIRSLRARSGTNTAGVNDVGTPIDDLVREWVDTLTEDQIKDAVSIIEPVDGRFWLKIGERIFVFSYFPTKKISAWSWYEPGHEFTDLVTLDDRIYAREDDVIYLYGGADNDTYTTLDVTCELPFLAGGKPGTYKQIKGFDIAAVGTWTVTILVDPDDEAQTLDVGEVEGNTFLDENIGVAAHTAYFAPKFVHSGGGYASISQFAIYNDAAESE